MHTLNCQTLQFLIAINRWEPEHNRAEIGYVISTKNWGKGYGTEVANAVISFGFEQMELERIQARCFIDNIASQRVMEKVGMTYEGTLRKAMFVKGKFQDIKIYSILREEFEHPLQNEK